jgi:dimethylsulfone monooxygenase
VLGAVPHGGVSREQTRLYNSNRFKLGLFAPNCSGGVSMLATELWDGSWEKSLAAVQLADEAGLEFILPLGRWHGYRGYPHEDESQGRSFETLTWASAVLAATREICIFGTLHVTFISPVFAAKMIVTADHVGRGRFALNIVTGSDPLDFGQFGVPFPDNAARYAYTDEWVTIVKRIWTETAPFDHAGTYFNLKAVLGKPKPYGDSRPLLVSAANSPVGRRFAAEQTDCLFLMINEVDTLAEEIAVFHAAGAPAAPVLASGHMVARATRREAEEYYEYVVRELGDWGTVDAVAERRTRGRITPMATMKRLKERLISGGGTYPVVGSYDDVAAEFERMCRAGLGGMAVGLFDYLAEFPTLVEVVERLKHRGLRT